MTLRILYIALGGAIGSAGRYLLDGAVYHVLPATFPYGTFAVNLAGCLLFGLVGGAAEERLVLGSLNRSFLLIGVLGGFTTFSSFTFETFQLLRDGEALAALANAAGQVLAGLVALWLGFAAGRMI